LNFTLALAISSMAIVHILALRRLGIWGHLKKYINFKNPILCFVGALEAFSEVVKVISLAVRLFGNLFAGEVLLLATSFLFAFFLPVPFLMLEILVGFIQALIFSSLIIIFYTTATATAEAH
jgi:F-type H+-transporting ATPase subunit a